MKNGQKVELFAPAIRAAGLQTTWEADGVYFALYEPVGDTFRDFAVPLSSVYERTDIALEDLPTFTRESVEATISADDLAEARSIVERLEATAND